MKKENSFWTSGRIILAREILKRIQVVIPFKSITHDSWGGPAGRYIFDGAKAEIGFISALRHPFCQTRNRLRLTPMVICVDACFRFKKPTERSLSGKGGGSASPESHKGYHAEKTCEQRNYGIRASQVYSQKYRIEGCNIFLAFQCCGER